MKIPNTLEGRRPFLDLLLEAPEKEIALSEKDIREEVNTFMSAVNVSLISSTSLHNYFEKILINYLFMMQSQLSR